MSSRLEQLLEIGAKQARVFDVPGVAEFWECSERSAERTLRAAVSRSQMREDEPKLMRELPPVTGPRVSWRPGEPLPSAGSLSGSSRRDWESWPCSVRPYYFVSRKTARHLGMTPPQVNRGQAEHDLGVTAVVFYYHREHPERAAMIRGEDHFTHRYGGVHGKCPDLLFVCGTGVVATAEFVSCYPVEKARAYLEWHEQNHIPTEAF